MTCNQLALAVTVGTLAGTPAMVARELKGPAGIDTVGGPTDQAGGDVGT